MSSRWRSRPPWIYTEYSNSTIRVRSGAEDAVLAELGQTVTRASAVYDSLTHPVPMRLAVQRLQ
jgi:hypothetical protein